MRRIIATLVNIYGSRYEISGQDGQWYVTETETGEIIEGPFESHSDALSFFDSPEEDEVYEEEEHMTEEEMAAMQHEKYLSWFDSYTQRLSGKFYVDGYVCSRNYTALERFVNSFNKSHSDAQLEIETTYDSEGPIYGVM